LQEGLRLGAHLQGAPVDEDGVGDNVDTAVRVEQEGALDGQHVDGVGVDVESDSAVVGDGYVDARSWNGGVVGAPGEGVVPGVLEGKTDALGRGLPVLGEDGEV